MANNGTAYYSHMFANMPQKFTSTHVKDLWDQDVFKPKWVIIAKAYSIIRGDIGTINAPLDEFLDLICPAIGIISVDQYLEKMKWEAITDADGSITLRQTSVPDYSSFEEHLVFTDMSEWDLIAIAIANGYIPQGAVLQNASLIQQGVFPAAAAHHAQQAQQQPQQTQQPQATPQTFANRVDFFRSVATDPVATASVVLGFNVKDMLRITDSQPVEWTGSLADLYDPETGFYDIEHTFEKPFNVGNISEPVGFDNIFSDSIRDGYIIPTGKFVTLMTRHMRAKACSPGLRWREPKLSLKIGKPNAPFANVLRLESTGLSRTLFSSQKKKKEGTISIQRRS